MGKPESNHIEGFQDQALLGRLVNEHRGGGIRMFIGLAGVIAGLVYLGMAGPKILGRWTECNQALEKGLTATDVCLEQEKAAHSRNHSSYKKPFDEEKERRSCGWALDKQGLTDKDLHAFCFAGRGTRAQSVSRTGSQGCQPVEVVGHNGRRRRQTQSNPV